MKIPEEEIDISKLSIYAGRGKDNVTAYTGSYPVIYHGTWQAEDQDIGIAIASISNRPQSIQLDFPAADYGLPPSGKVFIINIHGKKQLTSYQGGKVYIEFQLPPEEIIIVEITS